MLANYFFSRRILTGLMWRLTIISEILRLLDYCELIHGQETAVASDSRDWTRQSDWTGLIFVVLYTSFHIHSLLTFLFFIVLFKSC